MNNQECNLRKAASNADIRTVYRTFDRLKRTLHSAMRTGYNQGGPVHTDAGWLTQVQCVALLLTMAERLYTAGYDDALYSSVLEHGQSGWFYDDSESGMVVVWP